VTATLFAPEAHERCGGAPWQDMAVLDRIRAIVADTEDQFIADSWWPLHPADEEYLGRNVYTTHALWTGAAGILWALDALARAGAVELRRDYRPAASQLHADYLANADDEHPVVPGLWRGEAGTLLVADRIAPDPARAARLLECVHENAGNETLELMWGSPGTMLAAHVMYERTRDERWRAAALTSADALLAAQDPEHDWWTQELYGNRAVFLGPAHGFAGNVAVLLRKSLLDEDRRVALARGATAVARSQAVSGNGRANWPTRVGAPLEQSQGIRVQWCHGAPGMVCSLASLPTDPELDAILLGGAELTWEAGPLRKGAGLCHGTAGNGFAFLALLERTGNEVWLERAKAFAVHALDQVDAERTRHGRGRYSLWTGDVGAALFAWQCLRADAGFPTIGWW